MWHSFVFYGQTLLLSYGNVLYELIDEDKKVNATSFFPRLI